MHYYMNRYVYDGIQDIPLQSTGNYTRRTDCRGDISSVTFSILTPSKFHFKNVQSFYTRCERWSSLCRHPFIQECYFQTNFISSESSDQNLINHGISRIFSSSARVFCQQYSPLSLEVCNLRELISAVSDDEDLQYDRCRSSVISSQSRSLIHFRQQSTPLDSIADPAFLFIRARSLSILDFILTLITQLSSAVAFLHANDISHRSINPENCLVTTQQNPLHAPPSISPNSKFILDKYVLPSLHSINPNTTSLITSQHTQGDSEEGPTMALLARSLHSTRLSENMKIQDVKLGVTKMKEGLTPLICSLHSTQGVIPPGVMQALKKFRTRATKGAEGVKNKNLVVDTSIFATSRNFHPSLTDHNNTHSIANNDHNISGDQNNSNSHGKHCPLTAVVNANPILKLTNLWFAGSSLGSSPSVSIDRFGDIASCTNTLLAALCGLSLHDYTRLHADILSIDDKEERTIDVSCSTNHAGASSMQRGRTDGCLWINDAVPQKRAKQLRAGIHGWVDTWRLDWKVINKLSTVRACLLESTSLSLHSARCAYFRREALGGAVKTDNEQRLKEERNLVERLLMERSIIIGTTRHTRQGNGEGGVGKLDVRLDGVHADVLPCFHLRLQHSDEEGLEAVDSFLGAFFCFALLRVVERFGLCVMPFHLIPFDDENHISKVNNIREKKNTENNHSQASDPLESLIPPFEQTFTESSPRPSFNVTSLNSMIEATSIDSFKMKKIHPTTLLKWHQLHQYLTNQSSVAHHSAIVNNNNSALNSDSIINESSHDNLYQDENSINAQPSLLKVSSDPHNLINSSILTTLNNSQLPTKLHPYFTPSTSSLSPNKKHVEAIGKKNIRNPKTNKNELDLSFQFAPSLMDDTDLVYIKSSANGDKPHLSSNILIPRPPRSISLPPPPRKVKAQWSAFLRREALFASRKLLLSFRVLFTHAAYNIFITSITSHTHARRRRQEHNVPSSVYTTSKHEDNSIDFPPPLADLLSIRNNEKPLNSFSPLHIVKLFAALGLCMRLERYCRFQKLKNSLSKGSAAADCEEGDSDGLPSEWSLLEREDDLRALWKRVATEVEIDSGSVSLLNDEDGNFSAAANLMHRELLQILATIRAQPNSNPTHELEAWTKGPYSPAYLLAAANSHSVRNQNAACYYNTQGCVLVEAGLLKRADESFEMAMNCPVDSLSTQTKNVSDVSGGVVAHPSSLVCSGGWQLLARLNRELLNQSHRSQSWLRSVVMTDPPSAANFIEFSTFARSGQILEMLMNSCVPSNLQRQVIPNFDQTSPLLRTQALLMSPAMSRLLPSFLTPSVVSSMIASLLPHAERAHELGNADFSSSMAIFGHDGEAMADVVLNQAAGWMTEGSVRSASVASRGIRNRVKGQHSPYNSNSPSAKGNKGDAASSSKFSLGSMSSGVLSSHANSSSLQQRSTSPKNKATSPRSAPGDVFGGSSSLPYNALLLGKASHRFLSFSLDKSLALHSLLPPGPSALDAIDALASLPQLLFTSAATLSLLVKSGWLSEALFFADQILANVDETTLSRARGFVGLFSPGNIHFSARQHLFNLCENVIGVGSIPVEASFSFKTNHSTKLVSSSEEDSDSESSSIPSPSSSSDEEIRSVASSWMQGANSSANRRRSGSHRHSVGASSQTAGTARAIQKKRDGRSKLGRSDSNTSVASSLAIPLHAGFDGLEKGDSANSTTSLSQSEAFAGLGINGGGDSNGGAESMLKFLAFFVEIRKCLIIVFEHLNIYKLLVPLFGLPPLVGSLPLLEGGVGQVSKRRGGGFNPFWKMKRRHSFDVLISNRFDIDKLYGLGNKKARKYHNAFRTDRASSRASSVLNSAYGLKKHRQKKRKTSVMKLSALTALLAKPHANEKRNSLVNNNDASNSNTAGKSARELLAAVDNRRNLTVVATVRKLNRLKSYSRNTPVNNPGDMDIVRDAEGMQLSISDNIDLDFDKIGDSSRKFLFSKSHLQASLAANGHPSAAFAGSGPPEIFISPFCSASRFLPAIAREANARCWLSSAGLLTSSRNKSFNFTPAWSVQEATIMKHPPAATPLMAWQAATVRFLYPSFIFIAHGGASIASYHEACRGRSPPSHIPPAASLLIKVSTSMDGAIWFLDTLPEPYEYATILPSPISTCAIFLIVYRSGRHQKFDLLSTKQTESSTTAGKLLEAGLLGLSTSADGADGSSINFASFPLTVAQLSLNNSIGEQLAGAIIADVKNAHAAIMKEANALSAKPSDAILAQMIPAMNGSNTPASSALAKKVKDRDAAIARTALIERIRVLNFTGRACPPIPQSALFFKGKLHDSRRQTFIPVVVTSVEDIKRHGFDELNARSSSRLYSKRSVLSHINKSKQQKNEAALQLAKSSLYADVIQKKVEKFLGPLPQLRSWTLLEESRIRAIHMIKAKRRETNKKLGRFFSFNNLYDRKKGSKKSSAIRESNNSKNSNNADGVDDEDNSSIALPSGFKTPLSTHFTVLDSFYMPHIPSAKNFKSKPSSLAFSKSSSNKNDTANELAIAKTSWQLLLTLDLWRDPVEREFMPLAQRVVFDPFKPPILDSLISVRVLYWMPGEEKLMHQVSIKIFRSHLDSEGFQRRKADFNRRLFVKASVEGSADIPKNIIENGKVSMSMPTNEKVNREVSGTMTVSSNRKEEKKDDEGGLNSMLSAFESGLAGIAGRTYIPSVARQSMLNSAKIIGIFLLPFNAEINLRRKNRIMKMRMKANQEQSSLDSFLSNDPTSTQSKSSMPINFHRSSASLVNDESSIQFEPTLLVVSSHSICWYPLPDSSGNLRASRMSTLLGQDTNSAGKHAENISGNSSSLDMINSEPFRVVDTPCRVTFACISPEYTRLCILGTSSTAYIIDTASGRVIFVCQPSPQTRLVRPAPVVDPFNNMGSNTMKSPPRGQSDLKDQNKDLCAPPYSVQPIRVPPPANPLPPPPSPPKTDPWAVFSSAGQNLIAIGDSLSVRLYRLSAIWADPNWLEAKLATTVKCCLDSRRPRTQVSFAMSARKSGVALLKLFGSPAKLPLTMNEPIPIIPYEYLTLPSPIATIKPAMSVPAISAPRSFDTSENTTSTAVRTTEALLNSLPHSLHVKVRTTAANSHAPASLFLNTPALGATLMITLSNGGIMTIPAQPPLEKASPWGILCALDIPTLVYRLGIENEVYRPNLDPSSLLSGEDQKKNGNKSPLNHSLSPERHVSNGMVSVSHTLPSAAEAENSISIIKHLAFDKASDVPPLATSSSSSDAEGLSDKASGDEEHEEDAIVKEKKQVTSPVTSPDSKAGNETKQKIWQKNAKKLPTAIKPSSKAINSSSKGDIVISAAAVLSSLDDKAFLIVSRSVLILHCCFKAVHALSAPPPPPLAYLNRVVLQNLISSKTISKSDNINLSVKQTPNPLFALMDSNAEEKRTVEERKKRRSMPFSPPPPIPYSHPKVPPPSRILSIASVVNSICQHSILPITEDGVLLNEKEKDEDDADDEEDDFNNDEVPKSVKDKKNHKGSVISIKDNRSAVPSLLKNSVLSQSKSIHEGKNKSSMFKSSASQLSQSKLSLKRDSAAGSFALQNHNDVINHSSNMHGGAGYNSGHGGLFSIIMRGSQQFETSIKMSKFILKAGGASMPSWRSLLPSEALYAHASPCLLSGIPSTSIIHMGGKVSPSSAPSDASLIELRRRWQCMIEGWGLLANGGVPGIFESLQFDKHGGYITLRTKAGLLNMVSANWEHFNRANDESLFNKHHHHHHEHMAALRREVEIGGEGARRMTVSRLLSESQTLKLESGSSPNKPIIYTDGQDRVNMAAPLLLPALKARRMSSAISLRRGVSANSSNDSKRRTSVSPQPHSHAASPMEAGRISRQRSLSTSPGHATKDSLSPPKPQPSTLMQIGSLGHQAASRIANRLGIELRNKDLLTLPSPLEDARRLLQMIARYSEAAKDVALLMQGDAVPIAFSDGRLPFAMPVSYPGITSSPRKETVRGGHALMELLPLFLSDPHWLLQASQVFCMLHASLLVGVYGALSVGASLPAELSPLLSLLPLPPYPRSYTANIGVSSTCPAHFGSIVRDLPHVSTISTGSNNSLLFPISPTTSLEIRSAILERVLHVSGPIAEPSPPFTSKGFPTRSLPPFLFDPSPSLPKLQRRLLPSPGELQSRALLAAPPPPSRKVCSAVFCPTSSSLFLSFPGGSIEKWSANSAPLLSSTSHIAQPPGFDYKPSQAFRGHPYEDGLHAPLGSHPSMPPNGKFDPGPGVQLCISASGGLLVSACRTLKIWRVEDGHELLFASWRYQKIGQPPPEENVVASLLDPLASIVNPEKRAHAWRNVSLMLRTMPCEQISISDDARFAMVRTRKSVEVFDRDVRRFSVSIADMFLLMRTLTFHSFSPHSSSLPAPENYRHIAYTSNSRPPPGAPRLCRLGTFHHPVAVSAVSTPFPPPRMSQHSLASLKRLHVPHLYTTAPPADTPQNLNGFFLRRSSRKNRFYSTTSPRSNRSGTLGNKERKRQTPEWVKGLIQNYPPLDSDPEILMLSKWAPLISSSALSPSGRVLAVCSSHLRVVLFARRDFPQQNPIPQITLSHKNHRGIDGGLKVLFPIAKVISVSVLPLRVNSVHLSDHILYIQGQDRLHCWDLTEVVTEGNGLQLYTSNIRHFNRRNPNHPSSKKNDKEGKNKNAIPANLISSHRHSPSFSSKRSNSTQNTPKKSSPSKVKLLALPSPPPSPSSVANRLRCSTDSAESSSSSVANTPVRTPRVVVSSPNWNSGSPHAIDLHDHAGINAEGRFKLDIDEIEASSVTSEASSFSAGSAATLIDQLLYFSPSTPLRARMAVSLPAVSLPPVSPVRMRSPTSGVVLSPPATPTRSRSLVNQPGDVIEGEGDLPPDGIFLPDAFGVENKLLPSLQHLIPRQPPPQMRKQREHALRTHVSQFASPYAAPLGPQGRSFLSGLVFEQHRKKRATKPSVNILLSEEDVIKSMYDGFDLNGVGANCLEMPLERRLRVAEDCRRADIVKILKSSRHRSMRQILSGAILPPQSQPLPLLRTLLPGEVLSFQSFLKAVRYGEAYSLSSVLEAAEHYNLRSPEEAAKWDAIRESKSPAVVRAACRTLDMLNTKQPSPPRTPTLPANSSGSDLLSSDTTSGVESDVTADSYQSMKLMALQHPKRKFKMYSKSKVKRIFGDLSSPSSSVKMKNVKITGSGKKLLNISSLMRQVGMDLEEDANQNTIVEVKKSNHLEKPKVLFDTTASLSHSSSGSCNSSSSSSSSIDEEEEVVENHPAAPPPSHPFLSSPSIRRALSIPGSPYLSNFKLHTFDARAVFMLPDAAAPTYDPSFVALAVSNGYLHYPSLHSVHDLRTFADISVYPSDLLSASDALAGGEPSDTSVLEQLFHDQAESLRGLFAPPSKQELSSLRRQDGYSTLADQPHFCLRASFGDGLRLFPHAHALVSISQSSQSVTIYGLPRWLWSLPSDNPGIPHSYATSLQRLLKWRSTAAVSLIRSSRRRGGANWRTGMSSDSLNETPDGNGFTPTEKAGVFRWSFIPEPPNPLSSTFFKSSIDVGSSIQTTNKAPKQPHAWPISSVDVPLALQTISSFYASNLSAFALQDDMSRLLVCKGTKNLTNSLSPDPPGFINWESHVRAFIWDASPIITQLTESLRTFVVERSRLAKQQISLAVQYTPSNTFVANRNRRTAHAEGITLGSIILSMLEIAAAHPVGSRSPFDAPMMDEQANKSLFESLVVEARSILDRRNIAEAQANYQLQKLLKFHTAHNKSSTNVDVLASTTVPLKSKLLYLTIKQPSNHKNKQDNAILHDTWSPTKAISTSPIALMSMLKLIRSGKHLDHIGRLIGTNHTPEWISTTNNLEHLVMSFLSTCELPPVASRLWVATIDPPSPRRDGRRRRGVILKEEDLDDSNILRGYSIAHSKTKAFFDHTIRSIFANDVNSFVDPESKRHHAALGGDIVLQATDRDFDNTAVTPQDELMLNMDRTRSLLRTFRRLADDAQRSKSLGADAWGVLTELQRFLESLASQNGMDVNSTGFITGIPSLPENVDRLKILNMTEAMTTPVPSLFILKDSNNVDMNKHKKTKTQSNKDEQDKESSSLKLSSGALSPQSAFVTSAPPALKLLSGSLMQSGTSEASEDQIIQHPTEIISALRTTMRAAAKRDMPTSSLDVMRLQTLPSSSERLLGIFQQETRQRDMRIMHSPLVSGPANLAKVFIPSFKIKTGSALDSFPLLAPVEFDACGSVISFAPKSPSLQPTLAVPSVTRLVTPPAAASPAPPCEPQGSTLPLLEMRPSSTSTNEHPQPIKEEEEGEEGTELWEPSFGNSTKVDKSNDDGMNSSGKIMSYDEKLSHNESHSDKLDGIKVNFSSISSHSISNSDAFTSDIWGSSSSSEDQTSLIRNKEAVPIPFLHHFSSKIDDNEQVNRYQSSTSSLLALHSDCELSDVSDDEVKHQRHDAFKVETRRLRHIRVDFFNSNDPFHLLAPVPSPPTDDTSPNNTFQANLTLSFDEKLALLNVEAASNPPPLLSNTSPSVAMQRRRSSAFAFELYPQATQQVLDHALQTGATISPARRVSITEGNIRFNPAVASRRVSLPSAASSVFSSDVSPRTPINPPVFGHHTLSSKSHAPDPLPYLTRPRSAPRMPPPPREVPPLVASLPPLFAHAPPVNPSLRNSRLSPDYLLAPSANPDMAGRLKGSLEVVPLTSETLSKLVPKSSTAVTVGESKQSLLQKRAEVIPPRTARGDAANPPLPTRSNKNHMVLSLSNKIYKVNVPAQGSIWKTDIFDKKPSLQLAPTAPVTHVGETSSKQKWRRRLVSAAELRGVDVIGVASRVEGKYNNPEELSNKEDDFEEYN